MLESNRPFSLSHRGLLLHSLKIVPLFIVSVLGCTPQSLYESAASRDLNVHKTRRVSLTRAKPEPVQTAVLRF